MADRKVNCTTKSNKSHESITHLGGSGWFSTKEQVIVDIDYGVHTYFTLVNNKRADVKVVREAGKAPYLRTVADGYYTNNLLELPDCPSR